MKPGRPNQAVFLYFLLAMALILNGCGDQRPQNPEQIAFMKKIQSLKSEKDRLDIIDFRGKDDEGRIAPADIDSQVKKIEQEILHLLKNASVDAVQWNAKVSSVRRNGGEIVVHSYYGSQYYDLMIFDAESIKIAEKFIEDDEINFSGNLGSETSRTLFGALTSQEFSLYPTSVLSKYGEIKQLPTQVNERVSLDQARLAQQNKQQQKQAKEEEIKDQIVELCKNTLRSNLKYPESASFSWFKRNFIKRSDNKWTYYDVLEAKNDFGGKLPSRFECDATVLDKEIEVSVRLLD
ncbi:MAG: hypothetical protein FJX39_10065 [Alphaproteobacteria bacterium]|nr:hypothetical protein [Alphaproteobacteria bacterium]